MPSPKHRPTEPVVSEVARLFDEWREAREESMRAFVRADQAYRELTQLVDAADAFEAMHAALKAWAKRTGSTAAERNEVLRIVLEGVLDARRRQRV